MNEDAENVDFLSEGELQAIAGGCLHCENDLAIIAQKMGTPQNVKSMSRERAGEALQTAITRHSDARAAYSRLLDRNHNLQPLEPSLRRVALVLK